jgi:hypothetical protein
LKFSYHVFGLCLSSEIALVGLQNAAPGRAADVTVEHGSFSAKPGWSVVDGIFQLAIPNVAAYEVRRNGRIVVSVCRGSDPEAVQRTLLGKVMAAVAYQRGELPLHAATVAVDGRLIAVAGRSHRGKSTLAGALAQIGYEVVSDDLLLLRAPSGRSPEAMPGTTRLRLDSVGAKKAKKYVATPQVPGVRMRPLAAIYRLEWGLSEINPVPASDRITGLADVVHMWSLRERLGNSEPMRRAAFALVTQVPIFRFSRPRRSAELGATAALLERHFLGHLRERSFDRPFLAEETVNARRYFA